MTRVKHLNLFSMTRVKVMVLFFLEGALWLPFFFFFFFNAFFHVLSVVIFIIFGGSCLAC